MTASVHSMIDRYFQLSHLAAKMARKVPDATPQIPQPVFTISRTLGSGGGEIAALLGARLNCEVVDRKLVEQIAERADVRKELVEQLDEQIRSKVLTWVDGMLRRKLFDVGDYHHRIIEVVHALEAIGNVIIVGRGANFVSRERPSVEVRIVAPLDARVRRLVERRGLTRAQALDTIHRSDAERAAFIRRVFDRDWADPTAYDIVINTATISPEAAVNLLEALWKQRVAETTGLQAVPASAPPATAPGVLIATT